MSAPSSRLLLMRLYREHVRQYRRLFLFAFMMMALSAAASAAMAKLMEPVLDDIFLAKDATRLYQVAIAVFIVFAMKSIGSYGESLLMNSIGYRVINDLQQRLFRHLVRADLGFFQGHSAGSLVSRFTSDVVLLRATVSNTVTSLGKDILTLILLVGVMFWQDARLAAAAFTIFPLTIYPILRLGQRMRKVTGVTQEQIASFSGHLAQIFQGIRQVQAYGREEDEAIRVEGQLKNTLKSLLKANRIRSGAPPLMELIGGVAIVIVILYGGHQVIAGVKTTGNFFSFITALLMAYDPIKKLSRLNTQLQEGVAAAERLYSILDIPTALPDNNHLPALNIHKGEITFRNVTFAYGDQPPVLKNVSFTIPAGKTVALVGPSGGGKSTIINLLLRFYEPQSGEILIDGQDLRTVSTSSVRAAMALVAQETLLFQDSLKDNIAYGKPDASLMEIGDAARHAAAHDFITALPEGYNTMAGEHGTRLSGGQRQRIAIARALLKDAPILLLDEATSALDTVAEQQVQHVLDTVMKEKTTLVIAHRLSTIRHADMILVLEAGELVEQGTHTELLAKGGLYTRLSAGARETVG